MLKEDAQEAICSVLGVIDNPPAPADVLDFVLALDETRPWWYSTLARLLLEHIGKLRADDERLLELLGAALKATSEVTRAVD